MRKTLDVSAIWQSLADWSDEIFDAGGDPRVRDWCLAVDSARMESGSRYFGARVFGFEIWVWVR